MTTDLFVISNSFRCGLFECIPRIKYDLNDRKQKKKKFHVRIVNISLDNNYVYLLLSKFGHRQLLAATGTTS